MFDLRHFRFDEGTIISFSGGRTSGFLLWLAVQAHGGDLPEHIKVCFANTGKEMAQTLDFVQACSERWHVPVVWLEYNPDVSEKFEIVGHNSASRNGEPYEKLLTRKQMLPNPVTRFCTTELKIRTVKRYAMSLGWEHWMNAIGLRADEKHRVARINNEKERWETVAPLAAAGITKRDVGAFWQAQDFDLRLPNINGTTPLGNCDLCFLKSAATIRGIMRDMPELADWWIAQEKIKRGVTKSPAAATFRKDRPDYATMRESVRNQTSLDFGEIDALQTCYCHD